MKNYKIGDKVLWHTEDFDGTVTYEAQIVRVREDHAIAVTLESRPMTLYIDEMSDDEFTIIGR